MIPDTLIAKIGSREAAVGVIGPSRGGLPIENSSSSIARASTV